jgi:hypothetical protein
MKRSEMVKELKNFLVACGFNINKQFAEHLVAYIESQGALPRSLVRDEERGLCFIDNWEPEDEEE